MPERRERRSRLSLEERIRIGEALVESQATPQERALLARTKGLTDRTLRNYKKLARDGNLPERPPGRPPVLLEQEPEMRRRVQAILEVGGYSQGERRVMEALGEGASLRLVRRVLRQLKAEHALRKKTAMQEQRISDRVLAGDAVWTVDATHLGWDESGQSVQAEVLRERASGRTIAVSVGRAATAEEVVQQLDDAVAERGQPPLVLQSDNGSAYASELVRQWCAERQVVQLFNLPRTPQHNAAAEHGIGELKAEAGLPGVPFESDPILEPSVLVLEALERLDHQRIRPTRGGVTAAVADANTPSWCIKVTRERFYATACCTICKAVLDSPNKRARRMAERNAILGTLQTFELIETTRGGKPWRRSTAEGIP